MLVLWCLISKVSVEKLRTSRGRRSTSCPGERGSLCMSVRGCVFMCFVCVCCKLLPLPSHLSSCVFCVCMCVNVFCVCVLQALASLVTCHHLLWMLFSHSVPQLSLYTCPPLRHPDRIRLETWPPVNTYSESEIVREDAALK